MLKFLQVDQLNRVGVTDIDEDEEDIAHTRPSQNFTSSFHRKHSTTDEPFDPFTPAQRNHVLEIIARTQKKLTKYNLSSVLDVNEYLKTKSQNDIEEQQ